MIIENNAANFNQVSRLIKNDLWGLLLHCRNVQSEGLGR